MEPDYPQPFFFPPARSILKGLMAKNPKNRLGNAGINEIKTHPWFDKIDFGLLEAGYLDPPYVPQVLGPALQDIKENKTPFNKKVFVCHTFFFSFSFFFSLLFCVGVCV